MEGVINDHGVPLANPLAIITPSLGLNAAGFCYSDY